MEEIYINWTAWAKGQFPDQTAKGKINHLRKEVEELACSAESCKSDIVEIADCIGLLFSICEIEGYKFDDLSNALKSKLEINKHREWPAKPNEDGSFAHLKNDRI